MSYSTHGVKYEGDASSMVAAHKAIEASANGANAAVDKLTKSIKKLETAAKSGKLTQLVAALNALTTALDATDGAGAKAAASLKTVGAGTAKITNTAAKADRLKAALGDVNVQAGKAASSLKGVGQGTQLPKATKESDGLGRSFKQTVAAGMAFRAVKQVIGEMGDALREAREHAEAMADQSLGKRDRARQLASLMGESGPNDRVMASIFRHSMSTGMNFDESLAFLQEFEGSIPAGVQKGNIQEGQKQEVAIAVAQSALRLGLDAKTAGDMIGTIAKDVDLNGQVDKNGKKMTAGQAAQAQIEAIAYGLNEGRGDISVLARGEVATAAKAIPAGRMTDRSDVAAYVGVGSIAGAKSGASAGTFTSWMDRALNRATGPQAEFLKRTGIADLKTDVEKLERLKAVLAEAKAASGNPNFDPNSYLASDEGGNYGSEQDRAAMIGFVENLGVLKRRLARSREIAADPSIAAGKNATFAREKVMQGRLAGARMEFAEYEAGKPGEDLQIARKNAAARLEFKGLLNDPDMKVKDAIMGGFGVKEWAGLPSATQDRIDEEVRQNLQEKLQKANIDPVKAGLNDTMQVPGRFGGFETKDTGRLNIPATIKALEAKGVDPFSGDAGMKNAAEIGALPAPKVPIPANIPGANAPAPGAPGPAGPQAAIDASDLKEAAGMLKEAATAMNGGGGGGSPRRGRDLGPMPEFPDRAAPYIPGSLGGGYTA